MDGDKDKATRLKLLPFAFFPHPSSLSPSMLLSRQGEALGKRVILCVRKSGARSDVRLGGDFSSRVGGALRNSRTMCRACSRTLREPSQGSVKMARAR